MGACKNIQCQDLNSWKSSEVCEVCEDCDSSDSVGEVYSDSGHIQSDVKEENVDFESCSSCGKSSENVVQSDSEAIQNGVLIKGLCCVDDSCVQTVDNICAQIGSIRNVNCTQDKGGNDVIVHDGCLNDYVHKGLIDVNNVDVTLVING